MRMRLLTWLAQLYVYGLQLLGRADSVMEKFPWIFPSLHIQA